MNVSILKIILSLIIITISARVDLNIPINGSDIPITLQSLAVLTCAVFLSVRESGITLGLYLILGGLGFPIFSDGTSGWEVLIGNSGGYLFGFLIAAMLVSYYKSKETPYSIYELFTLMILGTGSILLPGVLYLAYKENMSVAIQYGLVPYIPGAIIKIIVGALLSYLLSNYVFSKNT